MRKATSLLLTIAFTASMLGAQSTTSAPNSGTSQIPDPTAPSTTTTAPAQTTTSPSTQTNAAPQTSTSTSTSTNQQTVTTGSGVANEIPSGTNLVIRTDTAINANAQNASSNTYSAQIARDVVNANGEILVPRNSRVNLAVYKTGDNEVQLGLQSLVVNGQTYQLNAATQTRTQREGLGKNKRTAVMVGGGAVLGTIVGAIAGGAKGAAVGAAIGAGGGAATQVMTRGDKVNIPAETELTFRLEEPIYLQQMNTNNP
jgi:hypothetical protein